MDAVCLFQRLREIHGGKWSMIGSGTRATGACEKWCEILTIRKCYVLAFDLTLKFSRGSQRPAAFPQGNRSNHIAFLSSFLFLDTLALILGMF
jgi:hypothetical protein